MNYATKFVRKKFVGEALQPTKCLELSKLNQKKTKKMKKINPFNSRNIEYIKEPTNGKLLPNIKFTKKRIDLMKSNIQLSGCENLSLVALPKVTLRPSQRSNGVNTPI